MKASLRARPSRALAQSSALLRVRERRALAEKAAGSLPPSMRMRQSLAQFEEAFREEAAEQIARKYLHFVDVYKQSEREPTAA